MSSRQYRAVDVFCGAGGLTLGFKMAGFKVLLGIDSNPNAIATYSSNNSETKFLNKDITTLDPKEAEDIIGSKKIDIVIGGPPCEGFSLANTRTRNMKNHKNDLFLHFVKFVEYFKPRCFLFENVPGILSMENGFISQQIARAFEEVGYNMPKEKENYKFYILNSANFGVPQIRKRVFLIGSLADSFDKMDFTPTYEEYISVKDAINDLPRLPEGGGGTPVRNYDNKPKTKYQKLMRKKSRKLYNHMATVNKPYVVERFRCIKQGRNWRSIPSCMMKTYKQVNRTHGSIYKRLINTKPANTISNFRKMMLIHPKQNRLLSIREAARLQSFPDTYVFRGCFGSMSEQVGDAVPVLMAKKLGIEILKLMN